VLLLVLIVPEYFWGIITLLYELKLIALYWSLDKSANSIFETTHIQISVYASLFLC
jgi:uncharacterized membrane protein YqjE